MAKYRDTKIKIRKKWDMNPTTRIKHSRKAYSRSEVKKQTFKVFEEECDGELYAY